MVRELSLYCFSSFNVSETALGGESSLHTWRECASQCFGVQYPRNVSWGKLAENTVQGFRVLTYFPSACSVSYWERGVGICSCDYGFVCFSILTAPLVYFEPLCLGAYTFSSVPFSWINWSIYLCVMPLFVPSKYSFLGTWLPEFNIRTFLWLLIGW